MIKFAATRGAFTAKNSPKYVYGQESAPDPTGGAYNTARPIVCWAGDTLTISHLFDDVLMLSAFCVSTYHPGRHPCSL